MNTMKQDASGIGIITHGGTKVTVTKALLVQFADASGRMDELDEPEVLISDLIADLLHLAVAHDPTSLERIRDRAHSHVVAERADESA